MTVAALSTAPRVQTHTGTGTTGPFTANFRLLDKTHVIVTKISAAGARTTLTEAGGDFTAQLVSLGASGISITLTTALAVGETLVIEGDSPVVQPTKYSNQGDFFPETHETSFDRITIIVQETRERLDRSVVLPAETSLSGPLLLPDPIAGRAIMWDATATGLTNSPSTLEDVTTVADNIASVNTVTASIANVNTVATNIANVNTVSASDSEVTVVADNIADILDVAAMLANNKYDATAAPTVNNDGVDTAGLGQTFQQNSIWMDQTNDEVYRCIDNTTGAAVWIKTSFTIDEVGTMATQSASNVAITGGSISDIAGVGIVTVTASGAVSAGDFIAINSDGTFSVVGSTSYSFSEDTTATTSSVPAVNYRGHGLYHRNADRFVFVNSGNDTYVCAAPTAGSITMPAGSDSIGSGGSRGSSELNTPMIEIPGTDNIAFFYPSSSTIYCRVGAINTSTNRMTFGTETGNSTGGAGVDAVMSAIWDTEHSQAVVVWQENGSGDDLRAMKGTPSGTSFTWNGGAEEIITSQIDSADTYYGTVYDEVEKKYASIFGFNENISNAGGTDTSYTIKVVVFEYDGTNFSDETAVYKIPYNNVGRYLEAANNAQVDVAMGSQETGDFVIAGFGAEENELLFLVCNIRDGFTYSNMFAIYENSASNLDYFHLNYEPDSNLFVFGIVENSSDELGWGYFKVIDGRVSMKHYEWQYITQANDGYLFPSHNGLVVQFTSGGSGGNRAFVHQMPWEDTNADEWVGVAQEAAADAATFKLMLRGGHDVFQSGLTPGSKYYLADDGTLTTTNNGRPAGFAVSASDFITASL